MIITFLMVLIGNLLAFGFSFLPTGSLPSAVSSSLTTVLSWMYVANVAVNVDALISIFLLILGIELVIQAVEVVMWIYSKIPVIGK